MKPYPENVLKWLFVFTMLVVPLELVDWVGSSHDYFITGLLIFSLYLMYTGWNYLRRGRPENYDRGAHVPNEAEIEAAFKACSTHELIKEMHEHTVYTIRSFMISARTMLLFNFTLFIVNLDDLINGDNDYAIYLVLAMTGGFTLYTLWEYCKAEFDLARTISKYDHIVALETIRKNLETS